ncbi:recombinase family protein [Candidatus Microgenomates bacterium]|nr:recombinase family protein [Candidatus Microgenomates bacterium]
MKYIAYCRKSTDEKDKQVLSIEQQLAELKEFANREHLEIVEFITEARTAKVPGREQFAQLLKRIEKGEAQGIVSWHPDRLARNSVDGGRIIYLLDIGKLVDLKFPQFWFESTPQGKFMLNIAFGQSKYYVDNLSENVTRGMRYKINNGIWPVKAPIGYKNDSSTRTIQIDSEKSKIIKKVFHVFAEGNEHSSSSNKSFTDISLLLHKLGISASKNKPLKPDQVKRILSNRFYIGIMKYVGEYHQGIHKLFISKELFDRVQKKIKLAERPTRKGSHNFAFNKLMKCGECGASITGEVHNKYYKTTKRAASYTYYRCTKKLKPCSQKPIPAQHLELQLRKAVDDVALPQKWANDWYKWLERDEMEEQSKSEENLHKLKLNLDILDKKLNILLDSYLEQVIDANTYKMKKNEFFEEKLNLTGEIEKIKADGSSWLEPFKNFIGSALSCAKIARAKNTCSDLAIGAKTVGSNFFLTNRQLSLNYNQGFASLAARRLCQPRG